MFTQKKVNKEVVLSMSTIKKKMNKEESDRVEAKQVCSHFHFQSFSKLVTSNWKGDEI
jgi:hypothetical protein